jgi:Ser/Thr protein kinase RdoA (MazF antagonist)
MFNYEPVITRVLSLRFPGHIPDVRAVHVENGWMLMRDFGGTALTEVRDIDIWKQVVQRYAEMQLDLIGNTQSLIALGVPDRNVDYLASQIERLMNELPVALSEEEQKEIKRFSSTLRSLCYQLTDFNIPLSLTHGDFWAENVIIRPNGMSLYFDWSDASISHPFFDMPFFLSEIDRELPHVPDAREQLRDGYLDVWTRYAPILNLRRAFQIAEVLGGLHQALFYYVHVLPGIESNARWEMQNMLPMLLRQVIAAVKFNRGLV